MPKLTKAEAAWLKKVQKVLNECPSQRLGFFTIGDDSLMLYDKGREGEINQWMDRHPQDFPVAVEQLDADFGESLTFPTDVHSVAG
ncbi:hypothetical protein [Ferrimonas kyonanensis]|uniref:hypothetical protein n=1 Tax=Ferrimonas kyonanensis TaxID=364763 RepID=UPI0003F9781A|nr:hypothetical protein [Ferrimonas kyonanensis]